LLRAAGSVIIAEVLPGVLAEQVPDAPGDLAVVEAAVERDAMAARFGWWEGLRHGGLRPVEVPRPRFQRTGRGTAYKISNAASNLPPSARPLPAFPLVSMPFHSAFLRIRRLGFESLRARFPHLTQPP
jgi:hypothetical protein